MTQRKGNCNCFYSWGQDSANKVTAWRTLFQFPKAKGKMKVEWCRSINLCRARFVLKLSLWIRSKVQGTEHSEFSNGKGRSLVNEVLKIVQVQSYPCFGISAPGSVGKIPLHREIISEFGKTRNWATWTWHCSANILRTSYLIGCAIR